MAGTPAGGRHAQCEGLCWPFVGYLDRENFDLQQELPGTFIELFDGKRTFGKHAAKALPAGNLIDQFDNCLLITLFEGVPEFKCVRPGRYPDSS